MKKKVLVLVIGFVVLLFLSLVFKEYDVFQSPMKTDYLVEETPTRLGSTRGVVEDDGRIVKEMVAFEVDKDFLKVSLKQGETKKDSLTIKNTGSAVLYASIDLKGLEEFVLFPEEVSSYSLRLEPEGEQTLQLIFSAPADKEPRVYTGRIKVLTDYLYKLIPVIVEVESKKPILSIDVEIIPHFKKVFPGEGIQAEVRIFNLLGRGKVDVAVEYGIKDLEGNTITFGTSVVAVETQMSFVRSSIIPSNLKSGSYVFYTKTDYGGITSVSSDIFEVLERPGIFAGFSVTQIVIIGVICLVLLFIILALLDILIRLREREREGEKKFEEKKLESIEKQLKILEEDYRTRLLSKKAYLEDKEKVEKLLKEELKPVEEAEKKKKLQRKEKNKG